MGVNMKDKTELSTEEIQKKNKEVEEFLKGIPTRAEVANYVNSLLEEIFKPEIEKNIKSILPSIQLGFMIIQSILIKKGVCTGEELKEITEEFLKTSMETSKKKTEETKEDS